MNIKAKHSMPKRFLAVLLCMIMTLGVVPVNAKAAGSNNDAITAVTAPDKLTYSLANITALADTASRLGNSKSIPGYGVLSDHPASEGKENLTSYTPIRQSDAPLTDDEIRTSMNESYIRVNTTGGGVLTSADGINCNNYEIGKSSSQDFLIDFYGVYPSSVTSGRKLVITLPLGYTINDSSWPADLTSVLAGGAAVYTQTAAGNVYTLNILDGQVVPSVSATVSIHQNAAEILNNAVAGTDLAFEMVLSVNDISTAKSFTLCDVTMPTYTTLTQYDKDIVDTPDMIYAAHSSATLLQHDTGIDGVGGNLIAVTHKTEGCVGKTLSFIIPLAIRNTLTSPSATLYFTPDSTGTPIKVTTAGSAYMSRDNTDSTYTFTLDGAALAGDCLKKNSGNTVYETMEQAGTFTLVSPVLCQYGTEWYIDIASTGTLSGTPAAMGTTVTLKGASASALTWDALDGKQGTGTASGDTWVYNYKNAATDSLTLSVSSSSNITCKQGTDSGTYKIVSSSYSFNYGSRPVPTIIMGTPQNGNGMHSNLKVTYEYEEAYSPIALHNGGWNFSIPDSYPDLMTVTVTTIDDAGEKTTKDYSYDNKTYIDMGGCLDGVAAFNLSDHVYISKIVLTYGDVLGRNNAEKLFDAIYRSKSNTVAGKLSGTDEIPDKYKASIKVTASSDQVKEVTATSYVTLTETYDNYTVYANDLSSTKVSVNDGSSIYSLENAKQIARFTCTIENDMMVYDDTNYPVVVVSGDAVEMTDALKYAYSSPAYVPIAYADEKGNVIQITDPSVYYWDTGSYYSNAYRYYDLAAAFADNGSAYATKLYLRITGINSCKLSTVSSKTTFGLFAQKIMPGYLNYDELIGTAAAADLPVSLPLTVAVECKYEDHSATETHVTTAAGKSVSFVLGTAMTAKSAV